MSGVDTQEHKSIIAEIRKIWPCLSGFERFGYIVSLCMMAVIAIVVVVALVRLGKNVYTILIIHALDPLDFKVFQMIFGNMLTLFIAMEFMHSIESVLHKRGHIIEVRTILLIAMLAISRKFIVMDTKTTSPETMAALGFILLSLGLVYWFLKANKETEND